MDIFQTHLDHLRRRIHQGVQSYVARVPGVMIGIAAEETRKGLARLGHGVEDALTITTRNMELKRDIVSFLRTNAEISKINFRFMTYKVYPTGLSKDVATLIDKDMIKIDSKWFWNTAASYLLDNDKIIVKRSFDIANSNDAAVLVHECTHALLDYQNLGYGSPIEHEAVGYLAEAVWLEANGLSSMGGTGIRTVCHRIAAALLASNDYNISASDTSDLLNAVKAEAHYAKKPAYVSDGFE
jgi:hypothetical protein